MDKYGKYVPGRRSGRNHGIKNKASWYILEATSTFTWL